MCCRKCSCSSSEACIPRGNGKTASLAELFDLILEKAGVHKSFGFTKSEVLLDSDIRQVQSMITFLTSNSCLK